MKREKDPIVDIEYKNPFEIREYVDDKETILDIKVTTNSGEIIDLEIQLISSDYLTRRMVRYHAGLIHDSLKKGEPYGKMKETISIWIVDDVIFDATDNFSVNSTLSKRKSVSCWILSPVYAVSNCQK